MQKMLKLFENIELSSENTFENQTAYRFLAEYNLIF
jgi:hypothetical protein